MASIDQEIVELVESEITQARVASHLGYPCSHVCLRRRERHRGSQSPFTHWPVLYAWAFKATMGRIYTRIIATCMPTVDFSQGNQTLLITVSNATYVLQPFTSDFRLQ